MQLSLNAWERFLEDPTGHEWTGIVLAAAKIVAAIEPTPVAEKARCKVFRFVADTILEATGWESFAVGSFASKTYTPDSDIDLTVAVPFALSSRWYATLSAALLGVAFDQQEATEADKSSSGLGDDAGGLPFIVRSVTFINADVKLVRLVVNNITVDISANMSTSINAVRIIHEADEMVSLSSPMAMPPSDRSSSSASASSASGRTRRNSAADLLTPAKRHLFKRSVVLIKAWLTYDAKLLVNGETVYGAQSGSLSSYAVTLMTLRLFLLTEVMSELHALMLFFTAFLDFDWTRYVMTIVGTLPRPNGRADRDRDPSDGSPDESRAAFVVPCKSPFYAQCNAESMEVRYATLSLDHHHNYNYD
jgi:hypothetical protein